MEVERWSGGIGWEIEMVNEEEEVEDKMEEKEGRKKGR